MKISFMLLLALIQVYFCSVPNWDYTTSVTNLLSGDSITYKIEGENSGTKQMTH